MSFSPRCSRFLLAAATFLLMGLASAAQLAVVDTVQAPAWLTRGTQVLPLTPGMEVKNNDRITTGVGARAYIKLAEGSTVKLGADTQFVFYSKSQQPKTNFRGALDIIKGAFRYTTSALGKMQNRDLTVRIGTSTIGVRGTDIWGRANEAEDMAVLIEGKVEMSRGDESMMLDKPMMKCRIMKADGMMPMEMMEMPELQRLARETEIIPGDGATQKTGRWKLKLGSADNQDTALALYDRARNAGYAARIQVRKHQQAYLYTVHLPGFANRSEALAAAPRLNASLGMDATIMR